VQLLNALEVVVAEVFVCVQARSRAHVLLDHLPAFVGTLASDDARQRLLAPSDERILFPERQDRQAFEVLVLGRRRSTRSSLRFSGCQRY
jgi:hypothetical protein